MPLNKTANQPRLKALICLLRIIIIINFLKLYNCLETICISQEYLEEEQHQQQL